ncbi:MAG: trypsin-like peptidase domain-containing protein [Candidatus Competibacteraceae bacterium]
MTHRLAPLALLALLAGPPSAGAGQYETLDYHIQQMIAQSAANDEAGVQTFREQLDNLRRPEAGDAAQAQPLFQQGLDSLNRNQLKEALSAFRQAFIADPTDAEIASQLGFAYLRLSRLKEAERLLVYALALAPARSASWLHLGQVYGQGGDATRAAGAFANAYRFAQDRPRLAGQLRQLAETDPVDAVRTGAAQALRPGQSAPATQSSPTAKSTPAAGLPPPAASAPIPASPSAAPPMARTTNPAPSTPPASGALLDSLRQGLSSLAKPANTTASNVGLRPMSAAVGDNPGQQIYQSSIPRTCLIITFRNGKTDSLGSGLLVSADGLVVTNHHVIENADNLAVKCGERESVARVGKRSKEPDLALLTTTLSRVDGFVLNEAYSQELIGLEVFVIGNPYGLEGTFSTGVISGLREIDGVRYFQISAPISPGNSGGPVILRDGSVIGIATMGLKKGQNLNFAIAAAELIRSGLFDPSRMKTSAARGKGR